MGSRGGIVARKAAEQRQRESAKYGLVGVKVNSVIAECLDRYGRWELGCRLGVLSTNVGNRVGVVWEGDDLPTMYGQAEARYKVDRQPPLWRIAPPHQRNIFDAMRRAEPELIAPPLALTKAAQSGIIASSPHEAPPLTEEEAVPKTDEQPEAAKTTPAKALARQMGIDPRLLRKFLRSGACSYDPVGQGGRYEFTDEQVATIRREYAQSKTSKVNGSSATALPNVKTGERKDAPARPKAEDFPPISSIDEVEQDDPTDDDLAALEDVDLSLDDLDL